MNKDFIFRIENLAKKEQLFTSSLKEEDGGFVANFTYNAIAQIVQATNENEMKAVCMAIDEYIRENNIDICYAINKDELNDLLHNHERLYKRLYFVEEQISYLESENRQLRRDLKMFKSVNEFINNYGIEKAREVLLQSEKTMISKLNTKAIEVLEDVKYHCMQESETLKYDFNTCVGVVNYIDNQITKLRGGENENLCQ